MHRSAHDLQLHHRLAALISAVTVIGYPRQGAMIPGTEELVHPLAVLSQDRVVAILVQVVK